MRYIIIAKKAALEAGKIHKKYFRSGNAKIKNKGRSYDLVTAADIEAEKKIVSIIKKNYPDHNILGEEGKYKKTDSEYKWVIDPLDGTNNFSFGIPIFCVSIALTRKDEIIAGVVYDVIKNEMFCAEKGKGAYLNGKGIRVSRGRKLSQAILITGLYYDRGKDMIDTLNKVKEFFFKRIIGLRRFGAAALDLCYVACGRATGFWEFQLSPWDFAAGKLIVEEAGGKVTDGQGKKVPLKKHFIVASNKKIHGQMLRILKK